MGLLVAKNHWATATHVVISMCCSLVLLATAAALSVTSSLICELLLAA